MIKELAFIGVVILYALFFLIILVIEKFRWYRKIEYLQSLGFKRFYVKPLYLYQYKNFRFGWYYDNGTKSGIRIFDEELNEISYKKLKERFLSIEEIWKQSQPNAIKNQNRYEV